ncbi:MAG: IclR family transcriptional regulator [Clostridiales Family XIII bacterium]|jgi:IclR family acetate operon transcriptional repressor|nr:IclR family transcriptional regulator [Clostridiales Family XIII bacterium]
MDEKSKKSIASVIKSIEIMESIAESDDGLGVTEISNKLRLSVSSTYHILNTLRLRRMVTQNPRTKKYHIGFNLFRISSRAKEQNLLGSLAMHYLERLRDDLGETANLAVMEGDRMVCVAQAESRQMLRLFTRPGVAAPFQNTGGGKLLASYQPKRILEAMLRQANFEKLTENTITDMESMMREIEKTREKGFGVDDEEREIGVFCVAGAVFDSLGDAVAAISVSGPTNRMRGRVEEIAGKIKEVAAEFSAELGYSRREA